jgi:HPt (histidine-containing phosphotransfer) domain-containing protein
MEMSGQLVRLNLALALERLGGDEDLLREIAGLFLEEYPSLLAEIHAAIVAGDARRLERSAHTLKGSVANFGAEMAQQAALRLEQIGRSERLAEAPDAYADLTDIMEQLRPCLLNLAGPVGA